MELLEILDGLDEETRKKAVAYLEEKQQQESEN